MCLASFGAVNGMASGRDWASLSLDAGNAVYAGVWEAWKAELDWQACPTAASISNVNTAGNVLEAMMGAAWLSEFEGPAAGGALRDAASFLHLLAVEKLHHFNDVVSNGFLFNVINLGAILQPWIPLLECAILAYAAIYREHPGMHCTRKTYDPEIQYKHFEAVRLGHPDGWEFHTNGSPPAPRF